MAPIFFSFLLQKKQFISGKLQNTVFLLEGEYKSKPLSEVPQGTVNINSRFKITRDGNLLQKC